MVVKMKDENEIRITIGVYANIDFSLKGRYIVNNPGKVIYMLDYLINITKDRNVSIEDSKLYELHKKGKLKLLYRD